MHIVRFPLARFCIPSFYKRLTCTIRLLVPLLLRIQPHDLLEHKDALTWIGSKVAGLITKTVNGNVVSTLAVAYLRQRDVTHAVGSYIITLHSISMGSRKIGLHGNRSDIVVEVHALGVGHIFHIGDTLVEVVLGAVALIHAGIDLRDEHQGIGNPVAIIGHG